MVAVADVNKGDKVRITFEGVVEDTDYSDVYLKGDNGKTQWVDPSVIGRIEVTKKALPAEPKAKDAVVVTEFGDRYVKRMDGKWHHLHKLTYWGSVLGSVYTWEELNRDYSTITELGTKPSLPKDHKVRDLNSSQKYERIGGYGTLTFTKDNSGLTVLGYTLKSEEAVALAWDILKAYNKVQ